MEKENCKVTIVIPNYKGKDYLGQCVKSLYTEDNTRKEIIIVDNASNDGSLEEVEENFPEVKCIRLEKNYGFCRAVNVGIQNATAPYVILLNNDTVIKKNFVKNLTAAIEKDDTVFSIEPKMIQYQDQTLIDSAGTYYNAFGWAFARGKDKTVTHYRKKKKIFAACGGAWDIVRESTDIRICMNRQRKLSMWEVHQAVRDTTNLKSNFLQEIMYIWYIKICRYYRRL